MINSPMLWNDWMIYSHMFYRCDGLLRIFSCCCVNIIGNIFFENRISLYREIALTRKKHKFCREHETHTIIISIELLINSSLQQVFHLSPHFNYSLSPSYFLFYFYFYAFTLAWEKEDFFFETMFLWKMNFYVTSSGLSTICLWPCAEVKYFWISHISSTFFKSRS